MTARRLAPVCLAVICLSAAPRLAPAADKGDLPDLRFRIYGSLLPGYNKADGVAVSKPMLNFIGRKVGASFQCEIQEGITPDDLFEFGKKLNSGEYHLGALWGIEYGWLREKYPNLTGMVVVCVGGETTINNCSRIFVKKEGPFGRLADLKGKRLALYKDMPLMERMFLKQLLLADSLEEPKKFFDKNVTSATVLRAAMDVRDDKAECVVMSNLTYNRLREVNSVLAKTLRELKAGETYPMPVIIGSPEVVNKLRTSLWDDLQKQFQEIHKSPEGKECVEFWRFHFFVSAEKEYQREVDDLCRKYPAKKWLTADVVPRPR